jgi:hypothetical protein
MSGDKFSTEMTAQELVEYIRRTPKKFSGELPDKMEKWLNSKLIELDKIDKELNVPPIWQDSEENKLKMEYVFRIIERHAPHVAMEPKVLVDYAIELTDEFLTQTRK